jgi:hypothetical protein
VTCGYCDADYDGTTGYDKYEGGSRGQLISYVEEEVSVTQEVTPSPPIVEPVVIQKSPLDLMKEIFNNNKII